jgi:hypothetical protein
MFIINPSVWFAVNLPARAGRAAAGKKQRKTNENSEPFFAGRHYYKHSFQGCRLKVRSFKEICADNCAAIVSFLDFSISR